MHIRLDEDAFEKLNTVLSMATVAWGHKSSFERTGIDNYWSHQMKRSLREALTKMRSVQVSFAGADKNTYLIIILFKPLR